MHSSHVAIRFAAEAHSVGCKHCGNFYTYIDRLMTLMITVCEKAAMFAVGTINNKPTEVFEVTPSDKSGILTPTALRFMFWLQGRGQ